MGKAAARIFLNAFTEGRSSQILGHFAHGLWCANPRAIPIRAVSVPGSAAVHQTKEVIESEGNEALSIWFPSLQCTSFSALLLLVRTSTRLLSGFSAAT